MALNTFIKGYRFTVTSTSATVGATYTNNGQTFTVLATIAAATTLICSGTGAPTASGSLVKASGTGNTPITFSAVDTNNLWSSTQNWTNGTIPISTDTFTTTFDAASPACTVNVANRTCFVLDFTNYVNTITMTTGIQVTSDLTLGSGMTVAGTASTGYMYINPTTGANFRSNGFVWPNYFYIYSLGLKTVTLLDNFTITGRLTLNSSVGTLTINGFTIFVQGDFTAGTLATHITTGTTILEFSGAGSPTWIGHVASVRLDVIINKSGGTLLLSGTITWCAKTFLHTLGTVNAGTSQLNVLLASTFNVGTGITFNIINSQGTLTLTTDLYVTSFSIAGLGTFAGTGKLNGDWSVTNFIITSVATTFTLTNSIVCTNLISNQIAVAFILNGAALTLTVNGNITTLSGNSYAAGTLTGTVSLIYAGTGTWSGMLTIGLPMNINTSGTLTLDGMVSYYGGGVSAQLSYTAGTVDSTTNPNSGISVFAANGAATILNISGIILANFSFYGVFTASAHQISLSSTLNATNIRLGMHGFNFIGAAGFVCNNLTISSNTFTRYGYIVAAHRYLMLKAAINYVVNSSIMISSDALLPYIIKSSTTTPAKLTFNGSKQQILCCDVQYIDSSLGNTIWYDNDSGSGTKSNTTNWSPLLNSSMTPKTIVGIF